MPLGRHGVCERALAELGAHDCLLVGRAGDGRGTVARAVADRWRAAHPAGEVVRVPLIGCVLAGDAARSLGHALGAMPCGDAGALAGRLRGRGRGAPLLLLLEGAGDEAWAEVVAVLGDLDAAGADVRLLGTRASDPGAVAPVSDGARAVVEVPPLARAELDAIAGRPVPDADGSPRLARLVRETGLGVQAALARVRQVAAALVAVEVGVGTSGRFVTELPPAALARAWGDRRVALAGGVRARLEPAPPLMCIEALLPEVADLLAWAEGGHLARVPMPEDALMVRALAAAMRGVRDDLAETLDLAEARLLATFGGVDAARGRLARRDDGSSSWRSRAAWTDGDLLAATGALEEALPRWDEAAQGYRRRGDAVGEARVMRRTADRLVARSEHWAAERRYREARSLARGAGDAHEARAAEIGLATTALCAGNALRSAELLERGTGVPGGVAARLAAVATNLQAGHLREAREGLERVERLSGEDAMVRAVVLRRRADLALRENDHEEALACARRAAEAFAALAEVPSQASSLRVAGDAVLAAGRADEARATLHAAIDLHVRSQDLRGLVRTLERLASVDELLGLEASARERRAQADEVRAALGEA
jgi:predicted negative regulator of RcsB-dependent stress response